MYTEGFSAKLNAAMRTDIGLDRTRNEDAAYIDSEGLFFIVADGVGGRAAGDVASRMAVDIVREALDRERGRIAAFARSHDDAERREITSRIDAAIRSAHRAVYNRGHREPEKAGMGTTLDVVVVAGPEAFVAHVGDTRTYLIRQGDAAQITIDHTMAELMVLEGTLSADEVASSSMRCVLMNAVGVSAGDLVVEIAHVPLETGDRLFVCTDGLHDCFHDEREIADRLASGHPEHRLDDAVELAKERGGHDNITGVLVDILEVDAGSPEDETMVRASPAVSSSSFDDEVTRPEKVWDAFVVELREPSH
jgi:protein phosphatase